MISSQRGNAIRNDDAIDGKDFDWQRTIGPRRPHTVAVMDRDTPRPQSTNSNCETSASCDTIKKTKSGKSHALCGCASRQPLPLTAIEPLPDIELPLIPPQSPLNDVTDLLFGIQSVEITVKSQNTD